MQENVVESTDSQNKTKLRKNALAAKHMLLILLASTASIGVSVMLLKKFSLVSPMLGISYPTEFEPGDVTPELLKRIHQRSNLDDTVDGINPNIIWLLAFPQSGAAFIMHVIHQVTQTATATNYGHVIMDKKGAVHMNEHDSVRVYDDVVRRGMIEDEDKQKNTPRGGPSLFTGNLYPPPKKHLLTWVAGDGACQTCHPRSYMYNFVRFREYCWRGTIMKDGAQQLITYNPNLVKGAVHLYRDPFDNIVLRFWAAREDAERDKKNTFLKRYSPDVDGFHKWCSDRDAEYLKLERAWYGDEVFSAADGVICRQDFYKLIMYHNNAVRVRRSFRLETLLLKFEDFYESYFRTIGVLVKFLDLDVVDKAPPRHIQVGFSRHYFTKEQRDASFRFMKEIAFPEVKIILNEYESGISTAGLPQEVE